MLFKTVQILLFALFFSQAALAFPKGGENKATNGTSTKHNKSKGNSTSIASQCAEIQKLTALMTLANNATKLASLNATKADKIKAKAAEAQTKLTTLEANTTVTDACPAINAERELKATCKVMKKLQKTADMATNETALTAFATKHNTTVDKLKTKAAAAQTKLTDLQSNATLVSSCEALSQKKGSAASTGSAAAAAATTAAAAASGAMRTVSQSAFASISAMVAFAAFMGLL